MENKKTALLQLKLTQKHCLFALTIAFLCFHPKPLGSEILTMTTYYPAPYGGYASLLTTGQTLLARDGGNVGIGTPAPGAKLHVVGNIQIVDGQQGDKKVLTSNASGLASWQDPPFPSGYCIYPRPDLTTCPTGWTSYPIPLLSHSHSVSCTYYSVDYTCSYSNYSCGGGGSAGGNSSGRQFMCCKN